MRTNTATTVSITKNSVERSQQPDHMVRLFYLRADQLYSRATYAYKMLWINGVEDIICFGRPLLKDKPIISIPAVDGQKGNKFKAFFV